MKFNLLPQPVGLLKLMLNLFCTNNSSPVFPPISLGFTFIGVFFAYVTVEVVTFHLCGWYVLGVFLLPAFTRLGHECQDLLSPCDEKHVCTD